MGFFMMALAGCASAAAPHDGDPVPHASSSATSASSAAPSSAPIASASAGPVAPPPDPSAVTVTTVSKPEHYVFDGNPSEWGSITILPGLARGQAPQVDGPSHVAVSITPDKLYILGVTSGGAKGGFQIVLHFTAPEYPDIGVAQRGGGVMPLGDCKGDNPLVPLTAADCVKVQTAYATFTAAETARYTHVLRIDANGVTSDDKAVAKILSGAQLKSKPSADGGFTFEAELPIAALPRATSAPIGDIGLLVSTATPKTNDEAAFFYGSFDKPIGFEPNAAVRQYAYQFGRLDAVFSHPQISYQPGEPNKIEVLDRDATGLSLDATERVLFTKLGGEGDLEFGVTTVVRPAIVALKGGLVTGFGGFHAVPKQVGTKKLAGVDGWVVVAPWSEDRSDIESLGVVQTAGFDAAFIDKSGNVSEVFGGTANPRAWKKVTPTLAGNLETLTLSGNAFDLNDTTKPAQQARQTWQWQKTTGGYLEAP
jgi:hypothetical protein